MVTSKDTEDRTAVNRPICPTCAIRRLSCSWQASDQSESRQLMQVNRELLGHTGRTQHAVHVRSDVGLRFANVGEDGEDGCLLWDILLHTGDSHRCDGNICSEDMRATYQTLTTCVICSSPAVNTDQCPRSARRLKSNVLM